MKFYIDPNVTFARALLNALSASTEMMKLYVSEFQQWKSQNVKFKA